MSLSSSVHATLDHARLDKEFDSLLLHVHGGKWDVVRQSWADFEAALTHHLDLEEKLLFPEFERADLVEARMLASEHKKIRELCERLAIEIDLHIMREETIKEFIALLRAHADREDRGLYRWAANVKRDVEVHGRT